MGLGLLTIVRLVLQVIIARLLGLLSRLDYVLLDFIALVEQYLLVHYSRHMDPSVLLVTTVSLGHQHQPLAQPEATLISSA